VRPGVAGFQAESRCRGMGLVTGTDQTKEENKQRSHSPFSHNVCNWLGNLGSGYLACFKPHVFWLSWSSLAANAHRMCTSYLDHLAHHALDHSPCCISQCARSWPHYVIHSRLLWLCVTVYPITHLVFSLHKEHPKCQPNRLCG